jgi:hypothetical protein
MSVIVVVHLLQAARLLLSESQELWPWIRETEFGGCSRVGVGLDNRVGWRETYREV